MRRRSHVLLLLRVGELLLRVHDRVVPMPPNVKPSIAATAAAVIISGERHRAVALHLHLHLHLLLLHLHLHLHLLLLHLLLLRLLLLRGATPTMPPTLRRRRRGREARIRRTHERAPTMLHPTYSSSCLRTSTATPTQRRRRARPRRLQRRGRAGGASESKRRCDVLRFTCAPARLVNRN